MLATLLILAATAQPTVMPEVVWRTTSPAATFRPAPQAAKVAPDGDGYLVAWSEVDDGLSRAFAGKLNAAGELTTIGVRTLGAADAPVIAQFGGRYLVAWLEPDPIDSRPVLVSGALDQDFKLVSARPVGLTAGPPVLRIAPTRAYLGSGNFLYELDTNGAPGATFEIPHPIDDLTADGGEVGYVVHAPQTGVSATSLLWFTWLYRLHTATVLPFRTNAPAAVSGGNKSFLVVWFQASPNTAVLASLFVPSMSFQAFFVAGPGAISNDPLTAPQVAWDGARWVIVWASGDGIRGAVVEPSRQVQAFLVNARGTRPAITASKPGRFLVTYEMNDGVARHLASRVLDFNGAAGRGRAIR